MKKRCFLSVGSHRLLICGLVIALALAGGCATGPEDTGQQDRQPDEVEQRPTPDFSEPPKDYLDVDVLAVVAAPMQGPAVILGKGGELEQLEERQQFPEAVLPIFISPGQAMAIQLGLDQQDFQRPMTHDLLHSMLEQLEGEIGKVQVDELRDGTFFATIFLITPTEVVEIDARPSDAIAMISGTDVPIYVSEQVMDQAGLTEEDLEQMPPADPGQPEDFDDAPTVPL